MWQVSPRFRPSLSSNDSDTSTNLQSCHMERNILFRPAIPREQITRVLRNPSFSSFLPPLSWTVETVRIIWTDRGGFPASPRARSSSISSNSEFTTPWLRVARAVSSLQGCMLIWTGHGKFSACSKDRENGSKTRDVIYHFIGLVMTRACFLHRSSHLARQCS